MKNCDLSNIDVVLYALLRLDGHMHKVYTEEIAFEAYKLAKERFGWRLQKFREMDFPDKEPVRITLMDAAKEKYGCLVEGRAGVEATGKETDGWIFTPKGAAWIRERQKLIEEGLCIAKPKTSKKDADRFRKQMSEQPLFKSFVQGNLMTESRYVLTDMLNTSPDASKKVIALKFNRLRSTAELIGDEEIIRFFESCRQKFPELLSGADAENKL